MNKDFRMTQTNVMKRGGTYLGTVPATPEGKEFIRLLRLLYRAEGLEPRVENRNKNRVQFRGTDLIRSNGGLREAAADRHDIYLRYGEVPSRKWYFLTLGELQTIATGVEIQKTKAENDMLELFGFNVNTLDVVNRAASVKVLHRLNKAEMRG